LLAGRDFQPLISIIPSDLAVRESAKPGKRRASEEDTAARPQKKIMSVRLPYRPRVAPTSRIATNTQHQDGKMQVDNPQETVELIMHGEIDESLYSRQL
jgi:hypothetical protein